LNGRLVSEHFPYLPIEVIFPSLAIWLRLEALLDTGFDGGLIIPEDAAQRLGPPEGLSHWRLPDGTELTTPDWEGLLELRGVIRDLAVTVSALGDETIMGRAAMSHFAIVLDHGRRLVVEP
jgi:predicted aspartyl protease